jgi:Ca2+-binding RTX toxin-like protein
MTTTFRYGTSGNDTFVLYAFNGSYVLGFDGDDLIDNRYSYGMNYFDGGNGNDTLIGGLGFDNLYGGAGQDSIEGGEGHDYLNGGDGNDILRGQAGNDRVSGGNGNDTLHGGDGNDLLEGGLGFDYLKGGSGIDTASYANEGLGVNVNLNTGIAQTTHHYTTQEIQWTEIDAGYWDWGYVYVDHYEQQQDTLLEIENVEGSSHNDTLTGNWQSNNLSGGAGNDLLTGGSGNDTLIGGNGNDTLTGGAGSDSFVFNSPYEGIDRITDFQYQQGDKILIDGSSFGVTSSSQFNFDFESDVLSLNGRNIATFDNNLNWGDFSLSRDIVIV